LKLKYLFKFAIVFRKYSRARISGLSGEVWWKNQSSKISWECPLKANWMGFRVRWFICFYGVLFFMFWTVPHLVSPFS
jgi:hypothetical protein